VGKRRADLPNTPAAFLKLKHSPTAVGHMT
jgi:hypothetical protein